MDHSSILRPVLDWVGVWAGGGRAVFEDAQSGAWYRGVSAF